MVLFAIDNFFMRRSLNLLTKKSDVRSDNFLEFAVEQLNFNYGTAKREAPEHMNDSEAHDFAVNIVETSFTETHKRFHLTKKEIL